VDGFLGGLERPGALERQQRHGEDRRQAPGGAEQPGREAPGAGDPRRELLQDEAHARRQERPLGDPAELADPSPIGLQELCRE